VRRRPVVTRASVPCAVPRDQPDDFAVFTCRLQYMGKGTRNGQQQHPRMNALLLLRQVPTIRSLELRIASKPAIPVSNRTPWSVICKHLSRGYHLFAHGAVLGNPLFRCSGRLVLRLLCHAPALEALTCLLGESLTCAVHPVEFFYQMYGTAVCQVRILPSTTIQDFLDEKCPPGTHVNHEKTFVFPKTTVGLIQTLGIGIREKPLQLQVGLDCAAISQTEQTLCKSRVVHVVCMHALFRWLAMLHCTTFFCMLCVAHHSLFLFLKAASKGPKPFWTRLRAMFKGKSTPSLRSSRSFRSLGSFGFLRSGGGDSGASPAASGSPSKVSCSKPASASSSRFSQPDAHYGTSATNSSAD
jgi:hypothetical protein